MKYCERCGESVREDGRYCPGCGSYLEKYISFSVEDERGQFCSVCGEPISRQYCGKCGSYAVMTELKEESNYADRVRKNIKRISNMTENKGRIKLKLPKISWKMIGLFVAIVLVVAVGIGFYVEKEVLEPKRQEASCLWVHYAKDGKIGFKDAEGNVKIDAKYINAGMFSKEGLTRVVGKNHLWGYMNYKEEMIIEPKFEGAGDFAANGLAKVCVNGKYGYIDKTGNYVIKPRYKDAGDFAENGLACVQDKNQMYGYIDRSGIYKIKPKYVEAFDFAKNGLARVSDRKTEDSEARYGYINMDGKYVIEAKYEDAGDFGESRLVYVCLDETYGYIDKTGKYIIEPQYQRAGAFSDNGLAAVAVEHERRAEMVRPDDYEDYEDDYSDGYEYEYYDSYEDYYEEQYGDPWVYDDYDADGNYDNYQYDCGVINEKGEYVIEPKFSGIANIGENGLIGIGVYSGEEMLLGWIDIDGRTVIEPQYKADSCDFSYNGLAGVCEKDSELFGYINEKAQNIIKAKYDSVESFSENGLACVGFYEEDSQEWKYGYMDSVGKMVIEAKYSNAEQFGENGLAEVKDNDNDEETFYINAQGKRVKAD